MSTQGVIFTPTVLDPDQMPAGTYRRGICSDGRRVAAIVHLPCGHYTNLVHHQVDATGNVTPSVVCVRDVTIGTEQHPCPGHYVVRLAGW